MIRRLIRSLFHTETCALCGAHHSPPRPERGAERHGHACRWCGHASTAKS